MQPQQIESLAFSVDQAEAAYEMAESQPLRPPVPETIEDTGLAPALIEQLILKHLYFRGELLGRDLSNALGLDFSLIEPMVEGFKRNHHIAVKRSQGMGNISAVFVLSDAGRELAREFLESNQYAGPAPVPLYQYTTMVREQRLKDSWLTLEMLNEAYSHMVVTPQILSQIGPAVNSGKSFLIYGQPGNGKTYLAEALFNLNKTPIFMPYAIECQGMIIQMYDPVYHAIEEEGERKISIWMNQHEKDNYDRRWFRARRPFIVSGGELALDTLDLSYNPVGKFYEAPLQLKANNGIYLIDDFGRQKVTPAEVLNRWIVPMEKRVDYLTFKNGSKMTVPFECFLVFSTNLQPENLGDEAFLRRIQYKMLMKSPDESEFKQIFRKFAAQKELPLSEDVLDHFIDLKYRRPQKAKRRCHPRDIITHAIDIIRFERRPWELNEEVLEMAFQSNFIDTSEVDR